MITVVVHRSTAVLLVLVPGRIGDRFHCEKNQILIFAWSPQPPQAELEAYCEKNEIEYRALTFWQATAKMLLGLRDTGRRELEERRQAVRNMGRKKEA